MEINPNVQNYNDMTETEKEHLILRCKDAKNPAERQKTMDELVPAMDFKALAAETDMFEEERNQTR